MIRAALIGLVAGVLGGAVLLLGVRHTDRGDHRVTVRLAHTAHGACLNRAQVAREANHRATSSATELAVLRDALKGFGRYVPAARARIRELLDRLQPVTFRRLPVPRCPTLAQLLSGDGSPASLDAGILGIPAQSARASSTRAPRRAPTTARRARGRRSARASRGG